ncbi:serine/threonine-protein kinase [Paenibacillus polysaccharolyticus]|uniref:serine/threonine-protein kinase n=1 Tax=Paenibacillus polysaccharolyticus TaxID=582692 RepID=UPI00300ABEF6
MYPVITRLTFNFIKEIGGEGANSKTHLAHDPQLDAQIVVKAIDKFSFNSHTEYFDESKMLYSSKHPNIMVINYACQDDDNVYLSMPFCQNGSLNSLINNRYLSVREIIKYSLDFLSGLHYIHTKSLIHFDVKPTNIIIDNSNRAVLTDFGLSKYADHEGFATPEMIYHSHRPPEAFITGDLTSQYDVYQAGLTLYRMCNGNEDFKAQCDDLTSEKIMSGIFPARENFLPHIPNSLRKCIKKALEVDPDRRYVNVLELMNAISAVSDNLDWEYSKDEDVQRWSFDSENTIEHLTLQPAGDKWVTKGEKYSKKTNKTSKITKYNAKYNSKDEAYKQITKLLKEK